MLLLLLLAAAYKVGGRGRAVSAPAVFRVAAVRVCGVVVRSRLEGGGRKGVGYGVGSGCGSGCIDGAGRCIQRKSVRAAVDSASCESGCGGWRERSGTCANRSRVAKGGNGCEGVA